MTGRRQISIFINSYRNIKLCCGSRRHPIRKSSPVPKKIINRLNFSWTAKRICSKISNWRNWRPISDKNLKRPKYARWKDDCRSRQIWWRLRWRSLLLPKIRILLELRIVVPTNPVEVPAILKAAITSILPIQVVPLPFPASVARKTQESYLRRRNVPFASKTPMDWWKNANADVKIAKVVLMLLASNVFMLESQYQARLQLDAYQWSCAARPHPRYHRLARTWHILPMFQPSLPTKALS